MGNGIIRLDEGWRLDAGHRLDLPPNVPGPVTPPKRRGRTRTTMPDFVPPKRASRRGWLQNISDKAVAQAAAAGAPAPDATALKAAADALISAYDDTDAASSTLDGKRAIEADVESDSFAVIRRIIREWKVLPNFKSSGAESELQAAASASNFDPNTYKPVITASIKGGVITIEFKKKGVDALAVYCRLRGAAAWTRIAVDTTSPCQDEAPLANPAVPEVREYMARGMIDDVEIGLASDIISITFAG